MTEKPPWPEYWVLLEIPANNPEPIKLLLKHGRCPKWGPVEDNHEEYFYNEHTCPTNYLRHEVQAIAAGQDCDPHGVFQFVKTFPVQPGDDADDIIRREVGLPPIT